MKEFRTTQASALAAPCHMTQAWVLPPPSLGICFQGKGLEESALSHLLCSIQQLKNRKKASRSIFSTNTQISKWDSLGASLRMSILWNVCGYFCETIYICVNTYLYVRVCVCVYMCQYMCTVLWKCYMHVVLCECLWLYMTALMWAYVSACSCVGVDSVYEKLKDCRCDLSHETNWFFIGSHLTADFCLFN